MLSQCPICFCVSRNTIKVMYFLLKTKLPQYDNIKTAMETAACVEMCDFLPAGFNEAAMG